MIFTLRSKVVPRIIALCTMCRGRFLVYRKLLVSYKAINAPRGCKCCMLRERKKIMGKAIIAFILSVGVGTWLSFFNHGIGVVVSISIIGAFLIYQNENKKDE